MAQAPAPVVKPGDNLVVEGIPPVPAGTAERVAQYTEFRSAALRDWHPKRREMLIGTRFGDTVQVHAVRVPQGARTQLTFFPDRVAGASFQPTHGNYFVFSKDVGGGEWHQLYRYDMADARVTLLTDGKSRNTGMVWNRAGDCIAYMSTRRTGRDSDLYLMDPADPKSDRLLLPLEGGGWGASDWSPDGRQIALLEFISINESRLWLVDVAAGTKRLITPPQSGEQVFHGAAQFSRDGKALYVSTDLGFEFRRLAHLDLATLQWQFLTSDIPWDVESFQLSDDGRTLALLTNEAGVGRLRFMDTATHRHRPGPALPVGVPGGIQWHKNNRELGFTLSAAKSPADVWSVDARTGKLTRWTTSETAGLDTSSFADARPVEWKSFDGRAISGFLYLPPARFTGKRPVVVDIHGGPEGQSRPYFLGRENYLLNELGIAIVYPNVRGSTGYGKTFAKLDNGMLREDSYKDIAALLDWIKAQPQLDGERILVTGGSYGGHMTLAVASNYSDRICCAIDVVGMSNLVTFLENTESYRRDLRRVEYGDERDPKMREFLTRIAPMTKAAHIRKPLFVVQGKNDPRVPASEALQMVETVRKTETPVWFLMANDEGHGFAKRKNRDFQFYAELLFIEQFLLK
ncbi:peptidase S9, prolyl oligopeptidase [Ramlibacter tataouinensis]|uniref:Peptidase S9, prolyl oligopeptidase n=1 Tax=Ramlibacter tataouinensis TaxID=94132 RepID=A0A127K034_9BURK|nr:peptidase S9, prolyl oligopeptidase [Ramlibacter tataouinensis]